MIDSLPIYHPYYDDQYRDWLKWRLAYEGGRRFIETYCQKLSQRESDDDFATRKSLTYVPRFAGSSVDEVKNSLFQRFVDITRSGGTASYQACINGGEYGVDLLGNSMNSFIGTKLLPELLIMRKVGIYIDMPQIQTLFRVPGIQNKPYLYIYRAEDIINWAEDDSSNPSQYSSIVLKEFIYTFDPDTNLPNGTQEIYKHFWTEDNTVWVQIYDEQSEPLDMYGSKDGNTDPINIKIPRIPFVVANLSHSLMTDIADYQVALMNIASSDLAYILKANYPFYVEQFDARVSSIHLKSQDQVDDQGNTHVDTGPGVGRQYPLGTERPAFIHPSSEPLLASIQKQEQLKSEIRLLLNLTISNLKPTASSAEARGFDERTLESGLSYIGLELEHTERQIGEIWSMYENSKDFPAIKYPEKYNLKSDEDRRKDCTEYSKLIPIVPSKTYQKEVSKIIANILLGSRVSDETLNKIGNEIDKAEVVYIDPQTIGSDLEHGIVSLETASKARLYPPGEVAQAQLDHMNRLKSIAISQSQGTGSELGLQNPDARGVPDAAPNPGLGAKHEKTSSRDTTQDPIPQDKTRGQGNGKQ